MTIALFPISNIVALMDSGVFGNPAFTNSDRLRALIPLADSVMGQCGFYQQYGVEGAENGNVHMTAARLGLRLQLPALWTDVQSFVRRYGIGSTHMDFSPQGRKAIREESEHIDRMIVALASVYGDTLEVLTIQAHEEEALIKQAI